MARGSRALCSDRRGVAAIVRPILLALFILILTTIVADLFFT